MNEAWRIKYGILVSDKILIFSLFVGCFYHNGPALMQYLGLCAAHFPFISKSILDNITVSEYFDLWLSNTVNILIKLLKMYSLIAKF